MSEKEAIEILREAIKRPNPEDGYMGQALTMAIAALEEIQQYRAIGTVDGIKGLLKNALELAVDYELLKKYQSIGTVKECREALEKQIPKKPHKYIAFDGIERDGCPRCFEERGKNEILYAGQRYCSVCGQAIERGVSK